MPCSIVGQTRRQSGGVFGTMNHRKWVHSATSYATLVSDTGSKLIRGGGGLSRRRHVGRPSGFSISRLVGACRAPSGERLASYHYASARARVVASPTSGARPQSNARKAWAERCAPAAALRLRRAAALERRPCELVGLLPRGVRPALRSSAYAAVVVAAPAWVRLMLCDACVLRHSAPSCGVQVASFSCRSSCGMGRVLLKRC